MTTIVSYGGGTNSTALIIGCHERGVPIDLILFADTGGERQETYDYIALFSEWCVAHEFPSITTVHAVTKTGKRNTLESTVLRLRVLPALAYGWRTCSQRFKVEPQERYLNHWPPAIAAWGRGERITKMIGFDADEERRAKSYEDAKYVNRYPLIEWQWGRDECENAIRLAGLPSPGKSSCFFCPAMRKTEVLTLASDSPDLFWRAVSMERNAVLDGPVRGLGRKWSWEELVRSENPDAFDDAIDAPCDCYDGDVAA